MNLFTKILTDLKVELADEFDRNFERKAFFGKAWKRTPLFRHLRAVEGIEERRPEGPGQDTQASDVYRSIRVDAPENRWR